MRYKIVMEQGEDGYLVASCPALPGCHSQGRTKAEAIRNIREAIAGCLEVLNARVERLRRRRKNAIEVLEVAV